MSNKATVLRILEQFFAIFLLFVKVTEHKWDIVFDMKTKFKIMTSPVKILIKLKLKISVQNITNVNNKTIRQVCD